MESAGTKPGQVRPEAIAVTNEIGIDISRHRSKHVDEFAKGAANAGLLAAAIIALHDPAVAAKLDAFRAAQTKKVLGDTLS